MEQWIYNNLLIKEHSLCPSCRSTLNDVSNRDYPNTNYFHPDIQCLDIDYYEKEVLHKSQADNTVDAVIGISSFENNRAINPNLLLIELRMNYQSTNRLSKTEMERKVIYTKSLLGGEAPIKQESLFIFNDQVAPQAKSWFSNQSRTGGELKNCITCSTSDFSCIIKSRTDFPYTPIHPASHIRSCIQPYYENIEWADFRKQVKYWCTTAYTYQYKNPSEFKHIKEVMADIWQQFRRGNHVLTNEEELEMEILEEDFPFLSI